jgi:uncharacterized protein (DUF2062 family)
LSRLSSPFLASLWHPRLVASVIGTLAAGLATTAVLGGGPAWTILPFWLLAAIAAGFAASGST